MAKRINSLAPTTRQNAAKAAGNVEKNPPKNSLRGLSSKEELNRRAIRDVNSESHKRPARRALKKILGSEEREKSPVLPSNLFKAVSRARGRGLTPRQINRIFRRPNELEALLSNYYNQMNKEQIGALAKYFEVDVEECEPGLKVA